MCGIVGAIAEREVSEILLEGLKRLEYRGYDSAGISLIGRNSKKIKTVKTVGSCGEFWGKSRITPCILPLLALQTWF